jgi:hypothetical protein
MAYTDPTRGTPRAWPVSLDVCVVKRRLSPKQHRRRTLLAVIAARAVMLKPPFDNTECGRQLTKQREPIMVLTRRECTKCGRIMGDQAHDTIAFT